MGGVVVTPLVIKYGPERNVSYPLLKELIAHYYPHHPTVGFYPYSVKHLSTVAPPFGHEFAVSVEMTFLYTQIGTQHGENKVGDRQRSLCHIRGWLGTKDESVVGVGVSAKIVLVTMVVVSIAAKIMNIYFRTC